MGRFFLGKKYKQFLRKVFLRGIVIGMFIFQIAESIAQKQDIHFKHLTTDNGLSQSLVRCIFQDSYGFIWVGTDNGLNRYDGRDFVVYKHSSSNDYTINNSDIRTIFEDSKGNLWIGTFLGLDLYDRKLDRFVRFRKKIPQTIISGILEDSKGNLWISTHVGLYLYSADTDVFNVYTKEANKLSDNAIRCMVLDKNDNVWVGTARGLNYFDKTTKTFVSYFSSLKEKNSLQSNKISVLRFDYENRLWIATDKGLDVFVNPLEVHKQPIFKSFRHDPLNGKTIAGGAILSLLEDSEHNLWIGTEAKGLSRLDLQRFNIDNPWFYYYKNDPEIASSLSHNSIYSLYEDKQKNLWVGTYSKGLDVFSRSSMRFSLAFNSKEKGYTLSSKYVNVFFEEGDFLWVGTDNGLNQVNKKNGKIEVFFNDPFNPQSISSNWVHSIFKDSRGDLWIGTRAGGLNKFNYSSGTFTRFLNNPLDSNSIQSNNIFAIYEDTKKNLWLGSMEGGLILFDRDKLRFRNFTKENASLATNYVTSIAEAPNNSFWLLTIKTLDRFAPGMKTISYAHNPKDPQTISSDINICLHKDRNNNLWIGTDNGINLLNTKTNKFKTYTIKDGLPDNTVKIILEDDHGNLWLGTNKGISKFIDATKYPSIPKFKNYSPYDGLQGFDFNRRAGFKDSRGGMYFGGANGVNYFHPDSIKDNTDIPEVRITDFLILNKPLQIGAENSPLKQNIYFTEEIKLSYRQSVFTIKFVALNYISPERNQYAYKMEGFDNEWNYVGNDAEAAYMNLKPGRYTFRVKASNNDGVWNEKGASLKIVVLPPWWATWWFKAIIALFVLLIISLIFYIRVSYYRNREKELNYLVQQRTKELKITNQLLMERQQHIEEQSAELMAQTENLKETNDLLTEKQIYIQEQSQVLEEINKQLSFLNATKDKIFSIIAHDLRNPFHTVMGFSELLMLKFNKLPQEKVSKYIQLIHTASLNGNNLLENLLHWSRSQTGKITYEPEPIDLMQVIRQTLNLLNINAHHKNITIDISVGSATQIFADPNMILTILRNLISNAIKFTPENGHISISSVSQLSYAEITIEDNGIGIAKEIQPTLFESSSGVSTKGTNNEQGTGLGLILCREFVERHGGKIWVESEPEKGSKFKFTIPVSRS
jgi:ligand-binding sensor domain-containing protein/signal transduction histidine kinase